MRTFPAAPDEDDHYRPVIKYIYCINARLSSASIDHFSDEYIEKTET
jgi:hypothetical protein